MMDATRPESLNVPLASMLALGVEHWRLNASIEALPAAQTAAMRYALRRIGDVLKGVEIEAVGLNGKPFDPGLAATVLDSVEDSSLPPGESVIDQTLSPMILWRGTVIRPAEVTTRNGPRR